MDSNARRELLRRGGWTRFADGIAHGYRHPDGDAGFVETGRDEFHLVPFLKSWGRGGTRPYRLRRASLFFTHPLPSGRPVRDIHRAEFFPLVSFLGVEPDPGILSRAALGRAAARTGGDAVLHLY